MSQWKAYAAIVVVSGASGGVLGDDCNANTIDDAVDVSWARVTPLAGSGVCKDTYTFNYGRLPEPDTDLDIRIELVGWDMRTSERYVDVEFNGAFVGRLFEDDGQNCAHADFAIITIPWGSGPDMSGVSVVLHVEGLCCGPNPETAVALDYYVFSPMDVNVNGVVDSCGDCLADLDGDGDADADDTHLFMERFLDGDSRADLADDNVLNVDDIDAYATAYRACNL